MTKIRFEHITKAFGPSAVVTGLDLTIEAGEFFTFVGPSGCGKSTLLNLIAGLEPATSGSVLFNEAPVDALSPGERDVAMVFQSYALYPHLSVEENIAFPLVMRREDKAVIRREVKRTAALLGIDALLKKRPKELSGGQRQRVALGRAIVRKPAVFLMDEPLSNLDAKLRIEMRVELRKLHRELGITTVYVTHDQGEAMALSDRIAVLRGGAVQQCDTPREVYRNPANTFVAGFMGSPAMNILSCPVTREAPLCVECNGTPLELPAAVASGMKRVLVGIRPEDARIETVRRENSAPVAVSVLEPEGAFTWVNVDWGGSAFKGIADPDEGIKPGDTAFLAVSKERVSLFDEITGLRLERGGRE
jgi:multiple sugar transport system ATP-binding protein